MTTAGHVELTKRELISPDGSTPIGRSTDAWTPTSGTAGSSTSSTTGAPTTRYWNASWPTSVAHAAMDRVRDGFVVPLPYGMRIDWLRNVLAARRSTIDAQAKTYNVV